METLISLAAIVVLALVVYFAVRHTVVKRHLLCPREQKCVDVEQVRRGFHGEGKAVRVKSCTVFDDPKKVECDQECLKNS